MDRTNVTDSGYTYNGQNYTKQTRTDATGNSYTVDIPTSISTASLSGTQSPIFITQPNYNVSGYQADGTKAQTYIQTTSELANDAANKQADADKANRFSYDQSNIISSLQEQLGGKAADKQQIYKDNKVFDLAGQLRSYNAQSQALNYDNLAKTLAEQNKATGQNITTAAVQRNTADATRENTIKIAGLAMQSAIAKADYDTAKEFADSIVEAKYDKITAEIEARKTNLAALDKYVLTPDQEKAKKAQEALIKRQEQEALKKKEDEKTINELIINANEQNAPKEIINAANRALNEGKTPLEIANILGVYAGDYRQALLLDQQLKTSKAQEASAYASIRKSNVEAGLTPDGKVDPNAPVVFKPLTEGQAKDFTYATRMEQSSPEIEKLAASIIGMNPVKFKSQMALAASPLTSGNVSPEIRQYYQAVQNFATATLRRESGATIQPSEFTTAYAVYVPAPGDDATTLAQKRKAREQAKNTVRANVPQYDQRLRASVSVEDSYLDTAIGAVEKVDAQTNNPISNYRMMLGSLPGTK